MLSQEILEKVRNLGVEERIMATVAYFDIFDLCLSAGEIARLMPGELLSEKEIEKIIGGISSLVSNGEMFALKGRNKLFEEKRKKEVLVKQLKQKIDKWKWVFGNVPFVEASYVCNYLSFKSVEKDSDIDLLVITKPGRIFLAKVFLTIYLHLFGVRRHGKKVAGRFCLSFYANSKNLNFSEILLSNDIYFVYWLIALKPLYGDNENWGKIEKENKWAEAFVENFSERRENLGDVKTGKSWWKKMNEWILNGKLGDFVEEKLLDYFVNRNQKKKLPETASVIVSEQMLKFHNHDKRADFRDQWLSKMQELGIKLL